MRAWWMVVVVVSGCATMHVELPSIPNKSAPEAERLAAWEQLRPVADDSGTRTSLVLNDGSFITDPEDVSRALEPRTQAFKALTAWRTSETVKSIAAVSAVSSGSLALFFAMVTRLLPLVVPRLLAHPYGEFIYGPPAAFAAVNAVVWGILHFVSNNDRDQVFKSYESSLRARLAVPDAK